MPNGWHCKRCKGKVELHYNHVGDCDAPGKCGGTFRHVVSLVGGRRCDLAFETLTHAQVGRSADLADHAYLSAGDTHAASGDRAYTGCFHCGQPRSAHPS